MLSLLLAIIFAGIVDSHSILRNPQSWNTGESKRSPCGGRTVGQAGGVTPTVVTPGADVTALWEVTAGDGNGPITITYVETDAEVTNAGFAAVAATQTLAVTMNPIPQRGTGRYPFTFKAPPATANCRGGAAGNLCYIQVKSTTNWYSCASLQMPPAPTPAPSVGVTDPPTPSPTPTPPPTPASCLTLNDAAVTASICAGLNGKLVKEDAQTPANLVKGATMEFSSYLSNGLIFRNSKDNNVCKQWLAQWSCGRQFKGCDAANPSAAKPFCKSRCVNTMYECDVDPLHESALLLMTCGGTEWSELVADAYGTCPPMPTTRNIHLKSISVGSSPLYWGPGGTYPTQRIYKGDKLVWRYTGDATLYKFPTKAMFDSCSFGAAVKQIGSTDMSQEDGMTWFTLDTSTEAYSAGQTLYYGSKIGCIADQTMGSTKLEVTIIQIPDGATVVGSTSDGPEERPENFPTQSPPGFLGNPDALTDSGSLERFSVSFFAVAFSLLLLLH